MYGNLESMLEAYPRTVTRTADRKRAQQPRIDPLKLMSYEFAATFAEKLFAEHGYEHHLTTFANSQTSYCQTLAIGTTILKIQLVFGYRNLDLVREFGYRDYAQVEWLMKIKHARNLEAVYWVVLHEFAHVVNTIELGQAKTHYRDPHGVEFVKAFEDLLVLFPWDTVQKWYYSVEGQRSGREISKLIWQKGLWSY